MDLQRAANGDAQLTDNFLDYIHRPLVFNDFAYLDLWCSALDVKRDDVPQADGNNNANNNNVRRSNRLEVVWVVHYKILIAWPV
jgi:hypothetical protein